MTTVLNKKGPIGPYRPWEPGAESRAPQYAPRPVQTRPDPPSKDPGPLSKKKNRLEKTIVPPNCFPVFLNKEIAKIKQK